MKEPKLFGVGFQKTGTSSLGLAFAELGYTVASYQQFRDFADDPATTREMLWARMHDVMTSGGFDAGKDTPFPVFYRELDAAFPGSKFVLVIRDSEKWYRSALDDFGRYPNEIHRLIYGVPAPEGARDVWIERYERHNREVQAHFADRPGDLLVMRLDAGEVGWERLCAFLGADNPGTPWPHANTRKDKQRLMFWGRVKTRLGLSR